MVFFYCFFPTPNFDFNVLFRAFSLSLLYYRAKIICSDIISKYFACIKPLIKRIGYSYIAGGTHGKWIIKSLKGIDTITLHVVTDAIIPALMDRIPSELRS